MAEKRPGDGEVPLSLVEQEHKDAVDAVHEALKAVGERFPGVKVRGIVSLPTGDEERHLSSPFSSVAGETPYEALADLYLRLVQCFLSAGGFELWNKIQMQTLPILQEHGDVAVVGLEGSDEQ